MHVRQEVEGHRVGAHGEQVLDDERGAGTHAQHNEPGTQTHAPRGIARGQGNGGRDKSNQGDSAHHADDAGQDARLGEVGSPLLGEGFA